ncbi:ASCH domain-containing protein [Jiella marina]|uniref:hypothetical protein n=1 Tax=Jiella sp. LLJ827 TaxID=2917712 RepID=UPI00210085BD|nr:hypothetical protein [Jiella sp. LLJ827]MCQ0987159.1 hypothetical protein [Jiella sp. LLJ827]
MRLHTPQIERALVIREPWIGRILSGKKTWEMRSKPTGIRGPIGLIRQGSGIVVGIARLAESLRPLDEAGYAASFDKHQIPSEMQAEVIRNWWVYPWVLEDIRPLSVPVPYDHPSGAVTFVKLQESVQRAIAEQLSNYREPTPATQPEHSTRDVEPMARQAGTDKSDHPVLNEPPARTEATGLAAGLLIRLSGGNIRNGHFYLRSAADMIPAGGIGGGNKQDLGRPFTVRFDPGQTIETDVAGDKMILRARGPVRDFFARSGAKEGDFVRVHKEDPRTLLITLESRSG